MLHWLLQGIGQRIGQAARREAVDMLAKASVFDAAGAQQWAQSHGAKNAETAPDPPQFSQQLESNPSKESVN